MAEPASQQQAELEAQDTAPAMLKDLPDAHVVIDVIKRRSIEGVGVLNENVGRPAISAGFPGHVAMPATAATAPNRHCASPGSDRWVHRLTSL
jgi:hypothetical protein